jgi:hypothetical protein
MNDSNPCSYDLVVAGLGIAGSMAAVSAARLGLRVLAFDYSAFPGGSLTSSGTGPMMTFHAGEKQVIRGLTSELVDRLVAKGLSPGHQPDSTGFTYTVTPFDHEGMKRELELMLIEAGVKMLYHALLDEVTVESGILTRVKVVTKSGKLIFEAPYFIDATGDAELAFRAGVPCEFGRPADGLAQPMTMNLRMHGVDIGKIRRYMKEHPEEFPTLADRSEILDSAKRLSCSGFNSILRAAVDAGEISFGRETTLFFETNSPGEVIVNMSRILGKQSTDPWALSEAEIEGRAQIWELFEFFKKHVPGFSNTQMGFSGPFVGVRSSRQIVGIHKIDVEELFTRTRFPDLISHCGYPVDIHNPDGSGTEHRHLPYGFYYNVPLRSMLTPEVRNLVTTGRCISADFAAQASLRLSPHAGALGHAAGVASAIAFLQGCPVEKADYSRIKNTLLSQNAFLDDNNGMVEKLA